VLSGGESRISYTRSKSLPTSMLGWDNLWLIWESIPGTTRTGKRHRRGRWKNGLAEVLAQPSIAAGRRPENPGIYIITYPPASNTIKLATARVLCYPPTTPLPRPQHPSLSLRDRSVATIRYDKGSDIPTNSSNGGNTIHLG